MLHHEFPFQHPLQKVLEGVSVRHVLPEKVEILWSHRINQISPSEDYFFRELKRRRLFQLCLFCFWLQIVLSLPLAGPGAHLMPGQGLVLHDGLALQGLVLKDALVFQDCLGQLFLHGGTRESEIVVYQVIWAPDIWWNLFYHEILVNLCEFA